MVAKPEVTMQIHLGTLIPIGLALASLAVWTGSLGNKVENLESVVGDLEPRIRSVETTQSGMSVRLSSINDAVQDIRENQKETNELIRRYLERSK